MHSLKKKVILTSLIVIFAMFATIGATFAWFTIDSSSSIDEVQLTVGSDVSLLIMMDQGYTYAANQTLLDNPANGQYVTQLTTSMITSVYDYREIVFEPVTTANGSTYTLRNGGSASASPTLPGAYIEFSVWILSQAAASNVAIRNLEIQSSNSIIFKNVTANAVRLSIQNQANSVFIFGNDKDYSFTYRADQIWYDSSVPANNSIASATATALGLLHSK
ncbi:MAG: hypothetical protein U1C51_05370, partial [Candidatus Izemoplasmatales bacterium]|nr:hypothetical protein [Candidatus Izemoplasmatales bacterium]